MPKSGVPKTGGAQFGVRKTGLQNWGAQNCQKTGVPNCPQLGVPKPVVHKSGGAQNLPHPPPRKPVAKASHKQTQTKNRHLSQRPPATNTNEELPHPPPRAPAVSKGPAETNTNEELPHPPPREPVAKAPQQQTQTKNCRTNKHKRRIATPASPRACRKGSSATNTNEELLHPPPQGPAVAKALQQQTQKKNCHTHLPESLSQKPLSNKHKRGIAAPTSPGACRKGPAATNTKEELPHPPPREPVAKAAQQQTQTKNCCTHLPESLLSQRCRRNKHKRRIVRKTSGERLCSSGVAPETIPTDPSPGAQPRVPN